MGKKGGLSPPVPGSAAVAMPEGDDLVLQADPKTLMEDLSRFFSETSAFGHDELQGGSKSILSVASCTSLVNMQSIEELAASMRDASPHAVQALIHLVQGQEAELRDRPAFFQMFDLAETMRVCIVQQVCKQAVAENMHQGTPIKLRCSVEQASEIRDMLRECYHAAVPLLTDATIRIRKSAEDIVDSIAEVEADGKSIDELDSHGTEWENVRVHAVILAASCEYLRGLWLGGFREGVAAEMFADIEDPEDAGAFKSLVEIVYGGTAVLSSTEELVRVFILADWLHSDSVKAAAVDLLEASLNLENALDLLGRWKPLPEGLCQVAVKVLVAKASKSSALDLHEWTGLTWTAVVRLLNRTDEDASDDRFASLLRHYALSKVCSGAVPASHLMELSPEAIGPVLALLAQPVAAQVHCTGRTAALVRIVHYGARRTVLSRNGYDRYEAATIRIQGPAVVTFSQFRTDQRCDYIRFGKEEYYGFHTPPSRKVARGAELIMDWATDSANADEGWSCEVSAVDDLNSQALLEPVTEWSKGGQRKPDTAAVCHCMVELCAAIQTECEKSIRWIEGHQRLDALLKDIFSSLLSEFGAILFVSLLEACHKDGRKPNLRMDVPASAACSWALRSMDEFFQSHEWLQIQPDAMLTLMQFAVDEANTSPWPADWDKELPQQLERWAREGHSMDSSESIRWLGGLNSPNSASFVHRAAYHFLASSPEECANQTVCGLLNDSRKQDEKHLVLCEGATLWCGQLAAEGRLAQLSQSQAWLELCPEALVHASRGALAALDVTTAVNCSPAMPASHGSASSSSLATELGEKEEKQKLEQEELLCLDEKRESVAEAISRWVDAASTRSVFEAISVAASEPGEAFQLICSAARQHCAAIESQNAVLEGHRHRAELDTAVQAARKETEARWRAELEEERARHEEAMASQMRDQEELRAKFITSLDALRAELGGAVTDHKNYLMTSSSSDRPRSRPNSSGSNRQRPPPVRLVSSRVSSLEPADSVEEDSEDGEALS